MIKICFDKRGLRVLALYKLIAYYFIKIIEPHQFSFFAEYSAIFFTNEGVFVDCLISSPIMHFSETVKTLKLKIEVVYLDQELLIVVCQNAWQLNQAFTSQFNLYPTKSFLRETNGQIQQQIQQQILRAIHWLTWDTNLLYCSKCGDKLYKIDSIAEKKCRSCHQSFFPNLAPAIMVLIQRDQEILLA